MCALLAGVPIFLATKSSLRILEVRTNRPTYPNFSLEGGWGNANVRIRPAVSIMFPLYFLEIRRVHLLPIGIWVRLWFHKENSRPYHDSTRILILCWNLISRVLDSHQILDKERTHLQIYASLRLTSCFKQGWSKIQVLQIKCHWAIFWLNLVDHQHFSKFFC